MADYEPYDGGGDYTRPRAQQRPAYQAPQPAVQTSQTPQQSWSQPSTPQQQSYTPPPNAGSWNSYYQQPGTTQAQSTYPSVGGQGGYPSAANTGNQVNNAVINAYRNYLGRDPSPQEIASQTGNGSFQFNDPRLQQSLRNIYSSPEALQYQQTYQQQAQSGGYGGYDPYGYNAQQPQQQPYQMGADFRYQTPGGANTQLGQYGNRLEGFESSKLNDPTRTSAKYMFGRLASKYEPTQQGFAQLMQDPEFQRLGMQSLGNGKIRLPNGDVIDVVRGFQSGGQAWQWGAETVNGQATDFGAPAQAPGMDPWGQVQQSYLRQQQAWQQQQQQQWAQQQAWQQQQQMMQQQLWQQYMQQMQQPMPVEEPYAPPMPDRPGYYAPPQQLPASPYYGGSGGYNTGVGLQGGGGSPYAPVFNYLAQGMPSPFFYG